MIHCVRGEKLRADRLREVLRPDNPSSMVSLEETIDRFYKEVSSAFHPLAAFCQIQRSTYEPLLERAEEIP
jgi:predicted transcriptional regulator